MEKQEHIIEEEREIDLRELFFALMHKKWLILLVTIMFAAGAFFATKFFMTPIYVSKAQVYIMNRQNQDSVATSSDISAATQLTNDAKVVVKSREVLDQVIAQLNLKMNANELNSIVNVSAENNTRILTISVSHPDAYLARDIADAMVEISAVQVEEKMGVEKMSVLDSANVPEAPSKPSLKKNVLLAGAGGFVLICMIILAVYLMNDKIRNAEDVERYLGLSNLGTIPMDTSLEESKKNKKQKGEKR